MYDKTIIGEKRLTDVYKWIDSAYAVQKNTRSHTVGSISMGHRAFNKKALVQRLNTKCSTKAKKA